MATAATVLAAVTNVATAASTDETVVSFVNGHWWNGESFDAGVRYVRNGAFVPKPRDESRRETDLQAAYVVPAFGEAHHHRTCDDEASEQFLNAGVLYVGIMNAVVKSRPCIAQRLGAAGIDVLNALAGLTERGAHPAAIGLNFLPKDAVDGQWVHFVNSKTDLEEVWSLIDATPPALLKVFLGYSEDYDQLRADPPIPGWYRGLNPALLPRIVSEAHARRLRVAVHVLSANDFDVAVAAGADLIAHMPGFAPGPIFTPQQANAWLLSLLEQPDRYLISTASATKAATKNIAVMTTMSGIEEPPAAAPPPSWRATVILQRRVTGANVATLRAAGVKLLIGSDRYDFTSVDEALYLVRNEFLDRGEALRSLTRDTPRALFPQRRIGSLQTGDEANFVILMENPLKNFDTIGKPLAVYKRGLLLHARSGESKRSDPAIPQ